MRGVGVQLLAARGRATGSRRARRLPIIGLLVTVLLAGCGAALPGSRLLGTERSTRLLASAEEAPKGLDSGRPAPPAPPPPPRPLPPRDDSHFGLRFGYMVPGEKTEWDFRPGGVLGVYGLLRKGRVGYELGLDFSITRDEDELYDSYLFCGRFDALFDLTDPEARWRGYLHCGLGMMMEIAVEIESVGVYGNSAGALNFGAGAALLDELFDLRATYCVLLDSHNAKGMTLLVVGVSF